MQIKIPGRIVVKDIWQAQNAQKASMSKQLGGRVIRDLRHFLPERDCMELATHIKEHRARLGMSQEELAEAIFVSRQTISNWETDRTYPDVQSLLLLSNLFDVSVDSLIKRDVEEMKQVLSAEAKRMNKLGMVVLIFGTVMLAWVVMSCLMDLSLPAIVIPAVVLFVPVAISAGMAEKIKHDKQLFTYRAYDAFIQGEDPDVLNEKNQRAGKYWWGKLVAKTLIAAAIGACCGWGAFSILGRLIG